MARPTRRFVPGQLVHLVQRGNNRGTTFLLPEDYRRYRDWLAEAAAAESCEIYAYVLMPNHVHLLLAQEPDGSISRMMQVLGRRYVRYFNHAHGRTGTLWEGRYRAAPIEGTEHFLDCCLYIETNPMRARL